MARRTVNPLRSAWITACILVATVLGLGGGYWATGLLFESSPLRELFGVDPRYVSIIRPAVLAYLAPLLFVNLFWLYRLDYRFESRPDDWHICSIVLARAVSAAQRGDGAETP